MLLYKSTTSHDCETSEFKAGPGPALTSDVKNKNEELADQKLKPIIIQDRLRELQLPIPKTYQVENHLAKYRREKFGPASISQTERRKLLDAHKNISAEPDAPFVLQDDTNEDYHTFRFFITSRVLISNAHGAKHFNADATYKLMWQGFIVLVVGTTDRNRQFRLIGVAVPMLK